MMVTQEMVMAAVGIVKWKKVGLAKEVVKLQKTNAQKYAEMV